MRTKLVLWGDAMERTDFRSTRFRVSARIFFVFLLVGGLVLLIPGLAEAQVNSPNPGEAAAQASTREARDGIMSLTNGLAFYALIACVGGIFISSALWAIGSRGTNPGTELAGKRGIVLCCCAAFIVGALPAWMNYLESLATSPNVDPNGATRSGEPFGR